MCIVCIFIFMNSRKLIKELKANGWVLKSINGDHHKFVNPNFETPLIVPHPVKDIPIGTYRNIRKHAKLD